MPRSGSGATRRPGLGAASPASTCAAKSPQVIVTQKRRRRDCHRPGIAEKREPLLPHGLVDLEERLQRRGASHRARLAPPLESVEHGHHLERS